MIYFDLVSGERTNKLGSNELFFNMVGRGTVLTVSVLTVIASGQMPTSCDCFLEVPLETYSS